MGINLYLSSHQISQNVFSGKQLSVSRNEQSWDSRTFADVFLSYIWYATRNQDKKIVFIPITIWFSHCLHIYTSDSSKEKMAFLQHKKSNHSNYLKDTLIPDGYLNASSQAGNYIFLGLLLLFRGTAFFCLWQ